MNMEIGCLVGYSDIRDYSLIDSLRRMSQQKGEDLKFATFEFREFKDGESTLNQGLINLGKTEEAIESKQRFEELFPDGNAFRKYQAQIISSSNWDKTGFLFPSTVLVPLNFHMLEQEVAFSLELYTRKDEAGNTTIEFILQDDKQIDDDASENALIKKIAGYLEAKENKVVLAWDEGFSGHNVIQSQDAEIELVVNQNGKILVRQKKHTLNLYLGQGFAKYAMDPANWPPVEEQSPGHLCAANAGVALIEYFERRAQGSHLDASRMFLHKVACNLLKLPASSPTSVRAVVTALKTIGVAPEEYCPYDLSQLDKEPSSFCYAIANDYRAGSYLKLDRPNMDKNALIAQIKIFVYAGLPVIFGFAVYDSIRQSQTQKSKRQEQLIHHFQKHEQATNSPFPVNPAGSIPFPLFSEVYQGGHAAVIVGYDDDVLIVNTNPLGVQDREKLLMSGVTEQAARNTYDGQPHSCRTKVFMQEKGIKYNFEWNDKKQGYEPREGQADFSSYKFPNPDFRGLFIQLKLVHAGQDWSHTSILTPGNTLRQAKKLEGRIEVTEHLVTRGAFKVRNSWGEDWGEEGYGWLPYAYVFQDLTFDFWSILKFEWMNTEDFGLLRQNGDLVMCNDSTAKDSQGRLLCPHA